MSTGNKGWKRIAAEWLALPPDALEQISRVTCLNGQEVIVENIEALTRVSGQVVEIDVGHAVLEVTGKSFVVTLASKREVHLQGEVESITYRPKGRTVR